MPENFSYSICHSCRRIVGERGGNSAHYLHLVTGPGCSRATIVFKSHSLQLVRFLFERDFHFILPLLKECKEIRVS